MPSLMSPSVRNQWLSIYFVAGSDQCSDQKVARQWASPPNLQSYRAKRWDAQGS